MELENKAKEILLKQLELLEEKTKQCNTNELIEISKAMAMISDAIARFPHHYRFWLVLSIKYKK